MAKMGAYCKAYPISRLREFSGWTENLENARKEKTGADEKAIEKAREFSNDDFLYLQENYIVTDGIFMDENIIFSNVTPEWIEFCRDNLKFELPDYQTAKTESPQ